VESKRQSDWLRVSAVAPPAALAVREERVWLITITPLSTLTLLSLSLGMDHLPGDVLARIAELLQPRQR
jgi:hypothetical protein